jgi:divalent metal cation (Fe/Co/Zn/Cd) transporter
MTGLFVAAVGIGLAHLADDPTADGAASIVIGLILGAVAAFMSAEIRSLIVGEAARPAVIAGLKGLIEAECGANRPIRNINEIRTMHLGPEDVLVAASVDFNDTETAAAVEATTARLERAIRAAYPEVKRFFLEVLSEAEHARLASEEARAAAPASPGMAPALSRKERKREKKSRKKGRDH